MRFEYFGLPGVGKSYLCRELKEYLTHSGTHAITVNDIIEDHSYLLLNLKKIINAALFFICHPKVALCCIRISKQHGVRSTKQLVTKLINLLSELQRAKKTRRYRVTEQGVLQAVWSLELLSTGQLAEDLLLTLAKWLPEGVILVEPPNDQLYMEQLVGRENGQSRFDAMDQTEVSDSLQEAREAIIRIMEIVQSIGVGARVLKLINDHQLDVADTAQWLHTTKDFNPVKEA